MRFSISSNMRLFFELLQVAIGNRKQLSVVPAKEDWKQLMAMSVKQSLAGIVFSGVERLPKEQWPDKAILFQWMGYVNQIEQRNRLTTNACTKLCERLENDGFKCCVLKGQANHAYYPDHLKDRRSCGDIDVWVVPKNRNVKHPVKTVLEYVDKNYDMNALCYLHAGTDDFGGIPVELHFRPSFMNSPIKSKRFLKHFSNFDDCICEKRIAEGITIPALKPSYDVVFQMLHIYRHLIDEGVGLRQVLDYYFLLMSLNQNISTKEEKSTYMQTIEKMGMKRFAGALMYVLGEVFALPREWMLCEPSEKDGRFLLEEIMTAGNFGQSDPRMAILNNNSYLSYRMSQAGRRFKRNMRFFSSYPGEVVWEPVTRVSHYVWKRLKLWKY